MKYIIIGLGHYGAALAEEFTLMGHEVVGADLDANCVENIKDKIATAFVLDATDNHALDILPITSVDAVIVAIGENFGASVKVVALLKARNVQHIFARAIDPVHKAILQAFNIDRILLPEVFAANNFVHQMTFGINSETFKVDDTYYVYMFTAPEKLIGYSVNELKMDEEFHLKIIGVKEAGKLVNCIGFSIMESKIANGLSEDYKIQKDDVIVCYGEYTNFQKFFKAL